MNVLGDILNAGENVEDQKDYGFTGSFFKPPLLLYMTIKKIIDEYATKTFDIPEKYREY